ncbi:MAG: ABC transporter permease subunit [Clostridiales bacterium]|nr:ABC transporter permease subunit [Clostridiales bacterium]
MTDFQVPVWGYVVMGLGLAGFVALLVKYILKNRGLKRPIFASPYMLWIVVFTVLPCLLVAYYAFTTTEYVPRFSFTLCNPDKVETVMITPDDRKVSFSPLTFTEADAGRHVYTITQADHDQHSRLENLHYTFVVDVEVQENGQIKTAWQEDRTDFKKSKAADGQLVFQGVKTLTEKPLFQGQYHYTLTGPNVNESALPGADGSVAFPAIEFSSDGMKENETKELFYTIRESCGDQLIAVYGFRAQVTEKNGGVKIGLQDMQVNFKKTAAKKDTLTFNASSSLTVNDLKIAKTVFTVDNFKTFWDSNFSARKAVGEEELAMYEAMGMDLEDLGLGRNSINIDTLVFSLWMAFLCTVICLLLGYPAAHIMADREFKLGPTLVILFVVPMWMNFLLRTIALMSLMEDNGLINTVLEWLGIGRQKLLNNAAAVQVGMVYNFLPFMVFPIYNVLNKMDYKLSEAAMDLGCNKFKTFYKVTLPLSIPGVVSGITMVFMPAVTTFYISRLLGGGKIQLFGDLIEAKFLSTSLTEWNVGSALSLVMMVLILLSLGLLQKVDPEGEGGGMV